MFELLGASHLYAAGLTLAAILLVLLLQPGIQRMVSLALPNRPATWIMWATLLLQAMFLLGSAIFIVSWLGMETSLAILVVLLLWLVVASLRPNSALLTQVAFLRRTAAAPESAVAATVLPVQSATPHASDQPLSEPTVIATVAQSATVVMVETKVAPPTPMPAVAAPGGESAVTPVVVATPPLPAVAVPLSRKPAPLTRRPTLGKKTTAALL